MRTTITLIALASGLAVAGCKGKDKDKDKDTPAGGGAATASGAGTATGSSAGTASGPGAGGDAPLAPAAAVDEAGARALVEAWLAAQNGGDFAAYEALYADKLEGIKRVGARTWRFDRAGWLADRKRMFKNPMTVTARDLVIRGGGVAATVELIQAFKQGKFADEGPKRLVLVKGKDGFQIAREEMLRSDVAGAAPAVAAGSAYLVVTIDQKPHVVISADANPAWGTGRVRGPFEDVHKLATMDAPKAPAAATWGSRVLAVHDAAGKTCDATVGALKLAAGGTPHFGEVQMWDGDEAMSEDGRVWTPAERAGAVWHMSSPYLVAELTVNGGCVPVMATDPATPVAAYGQAGAPTDAATAIDAFRKLPAYRDLQRDFTSNYDGKGEWAPSPQVTAFIGTAGRYLVVSAAEGSGCGDFLGQLAVVFEDRGGALVPLPLPDGFLRVALLADTDGDGAIEAFGTLEDYRQVAGHFEAGAAGWTQLAEVSFPNNDCGC